MRKSLETPYRKSQTGSGGSIFMEYEPFELMLL